MPIPTHERMLHPILAIAANEDITRKDVTPRVADFFNLTPEERESRIASGSTYVRNRVGWSMTFLTKASLIAKVAPRTYRITERGRTFLNEHPSEIRISDLRGLPGWHEAWGGGSGDQPSKDAEPTISAESTPLEALDNAVNTLNADLKN